jgi:hypothetical protein
MKATAILVVLFALLAVGDPARGDPNPGLKAVADSSTDIARQGDRGAGFEAIKGKVQSFEIKLEGDRFFQSGTLSTGTTLEEVWERVENRK